MDRFPPAARWAALLAATIAMAPPAHAASIHDSFSDGAGIIQTDTAPYVEAYVASAEAPGGGRYIANEVGAGIAQPGKFTFGAIQAGAYFTLADAAYPLYTNLSYGIAHGFGQDLSLNLLSEGAFVLDFRYISGPISLTATVYTSNGPGQAGSVADFALPVNASLGQTVVLPFASFINAGSNPVPVNWGDIDGITFIVSGPGGAGFALDSFSTQPVPEPASVAMLLGGLGLIAGVKARQRR